MQEQVIEGYRLSPYQKHLWLLQQDGTPYSAVCFVALAGPLDAARLHSAISRVVMRHEILRTSFHRMPGVRVPVQVVHESREFAWQQIDLSADDAHTQEAELQRLYEQERARGVDFEGVVLQATLAALSPDRHVLIIGLPALCADARTLQNLLSEITLYYGASPEHSAEEPFQYADFSEWRNEMVESDEEEAERGRAYWRKQETDAPASVTLPFEARPSEEAAASVAVPERVAMQIDAAVADGIGKLAVQHGVTADNVLLACWQALLWRLSGQAEVVIGYVSDGRKYEELHDAAGLFAKAVPVRVEIDGRMRFSDLVRRVVERVTEAKEWEAYYDGWEAASGGDLEAAAGGIGYEYERREAGQYEARGVQFSVEQQHSRIERYKLKLSCVSAGASLRAGIEYDPRHYERALVERVAEQYQQLVASAVAAPEAPVSRLNLLSEPARRQLLVEWNQTAVEFARHRCVHELFAWWAGRTPEATAVVCAGQRLSYAELNERANQLAHHLRRLGVGASSVVGLLVERSVELMVGLLGILKSGGAYLPLNPEHPAARRLHQLTDAGAEVLVTHEAVAAAAEGYGGRVLRLDADWGQVASESRNNPEAVAGPEDIAYVIYTSGSTGVPKGVAVRHRNLVNYTEAICAQLQAGGATESGESGAGRQPWSYATVTTISADLGNTSIYGALSSGGCLHLVSYEAATDAERFARYMREHRIDVLKIVPSHLSALLGAGAGVLPRRYLILGGEALSWELVERVRTAGSSGGSGQPCQVINHYGPTETTVGVLTYHLGGADEAEVAGQMATVPIGRPIANTQAYILDEDF